jgi:hypothetical protein
VGPSCYTESDEEGKFYGIYVRGLTHSHTAQIKHPRVQFITLCHGVSRCVQFATCV